MLPLINQFVYRPDATSAPADFRPTALSLNYEEVAVQTEDGITLSGWYLPGRGEPHAALLYCHGNAGDIRDWVHAAPPYVEAGVSLLVWDYRGYGQSEGRPSEAGLYQDGEAVWRWLHERAARDGVPARLLGKSLGSAVAIHVAARHAGSLLQPTGLILDSAFTSMQEVIVGVAPVPGELIPPLYESIKKIAALRCPTLVIHGGQDSLVPVEQGRRLYEALAAPKAWAVVERAGHNDLSAYPEYYRQVLGFLEDPDGYVAEAEA